jgi:hypothetical protein
MSVRTLSNDSSSNFGRVLKPEAQANKNRCYSFACASGFNNANLELLNDENIRVWT